MKPAWLKTLLGRADEALKSVGEKRFGTHAIRVEMFEAFRVAEEALCEYRAARMNGVKAPRGGDREALWLREKLARELAKAAG
jgi:hypothetical protein